MSLVRLVAVVSALLITLFATLPAGAHKVKFFCAYDEGQVCCRAWFGKNAPAMKVKVEIKTKKGQPVATGKTGNKGRVCFKTKQKPPFACFVDAGAGHTAQFEVEADE
jgi:hypothetical protein